MLFEDFRPLLRALDHYILLPIFTFNFNYIFVTCFNGCFQFLQLFCKSLVVRDNSAVRCNTCNIWSTHKRFGRFLPCFWCLTRFCRTDLILGLTQSRTIQMTRLISPHIASLFLGKVNWFQENILLAGSALEVILYIVEHIRNLMKFKNFIWSLNAWDLYQWWNDLYLYLPLIVLSSQVLSSCVFASGIQIVGQPPTKTRS